VEQTARLETFDIFSHAARTGCNLLYRPSACNDRDLVWPLDKPRFDNVSEAENEDDVRLMDGMEESDDLMNNGELGGVVSGDCRVGLAHAFPWHKSTGRPDRKRSKEDRPV